MSGRISTIILLEDDRILRELLADGLRHEGYTAVEAPTGAQAVTELAAVDGHAILVADRSVDKDGPSGFQLAADALAQYPALRVVYISGTHIAVRRRPLGERERGLLKPLAMRQLLQAVRELGG